jgi:hypothetical protein
MRKGLTMRALTLLLSLVVMAHIALAQDGANCREVGGAILTNFLDQATTLGAATGDLKGGLGVSVLGVSQGPNGILIFNNQHHWVTEAGDTLLLNNASATAWPTGVPGFYAVRYVDGVTISGGTGRFAGASGKLAIFGGVDLTTQQVILRYAGQVCSPHVSH